MARPAGNPELNNFVADALLKKGSSYDELKGLLAECRKRAELDPTDDEAVLQLSTLIAAVTANVSAIREGKHQALVSDILGIRVWSAAPMVLTAVLEFTRNLVVANAAFSHTCFQLLVYSFTPPPAPSNPNDPSQDPHGPWRPAEQAVTVHSSLLSVLGRVLGLVPTASTNILPLMVSQMPHKVRDRNTQCLYLSALFRIAEDRSGAPIREALLTAVMEHLLSLDVEIKWEDIVDVPTGEEEEEDAEEEAVADDIFELEGMLASELDINAGPEELAQRSAVLAMRRHGPTPDSRGGWEGALPGTQGQAQQQQQSQPSTRPPVDEMANKLDSMMELAFEHLGKRIAAGELRQLWDTLLSAFERSILNTHRSKFTQFLVFYACLSNPSHCSPSFLRLLVSRLRDTRQPPITRAACSAYLASFLARAAFLPESLVVKTLQDLAAFCQDYCSNQGAGTGPGPVSRAASACGLPDTSPFAGLAHEETASQTQRHQVFYATAQAVLYVLCYHMQPLVGSLHAGGKPPSADGVAPVHTSAERRQLAETVVALVRGPVWQVLNHRLQPLGVCLPSVAAEFVHQATSLGIVDCRPLLSQVEPATRSQRPLEMFFPFDPYLLRRSSRFLQLKTSYVRWRHGHPQAAAGTGADASDDEEDGVHADSDDGNEDDEQRSSSSDGDDEEDDSDDEDGSLVEQSLPSDAVLHDPTHRLHGARRNPPKHHHSNGHVHPAARGMHGSHGAGRGRGNMVMGTSYMSYASASETTSHGDGGMSPYGMSPYEGGNLLVENPMGTSPGTCPMSLGTPLAAHYMNSVPMRIARR
ncbi:hypothetical protein HXX76_006484 [Chlamydomonas incerta]|uniref:RNA polymerase I-specific transcription initiation factor RRN3 n=1 Tax=Chlamydomonas incerta TaxID=51695 RepID=A0A835TAV6_CHLIN|nr:hypothetical protein HXX76_006484 [Chlamydomonas incerta]|eukprot:KAG2436969.1 hypothetical protein HXX76_006484 [Chlamydomonas incerta]